MPANKWFRLTVFGLITPILLLALFLHLAADAAASQAADTGPIAAMPIDDAAPAGAFDGWRLADSGRAFRLPDTSAEAITPTTLSVTILSTPRAILDHNDPGGSPGDPSPNVFIVEAVVTNTGDYDAVDLEVTLDYNEDPGNDWRLLPNEVPLRTPAGNLAPGEEFYAYWFATYPIVTGQSHQYTVTASAEQVDPVSTSTNAFETPAPGATVLTIEALSTGNSGITQIEADIVVGVVYTITVIYYLGTDPQTLTLSPAGNPEFDAGSTRLLASSVRLYNSTYPTGITIPDRLYLPSVPEVGPFSAPDTAEVTYTLLPVTPASTEICSYAAVGYGGRPKYDQAAERPS